ncbi:hypothetical protein Y1Q_0016191 [Alligator mississippiensis]|uniref:Uncharacterized protein n=1 Tax=Alligator mississippiensis TaxID=8496 RepID=A0A151P1N3_ALLMI|nr:hypothetical protein Y1Q_0016191 [Alligator mississippiensis]
MGWQCNTRCLSLPGSAPHSQSSVLPANAVRSPQVSRSMCPAVFISSQIRPFLPELRSSRQRCEKSSGKAHL